MNKINLVGNIADREKAPSPYTVNGSEKKSREQK